MDATSIVSPDSAVAPSDSGFPETSAPAPLKKTTTKQAVIANHRAARKRAVESLTRDGQQDAALPGVLRKLKKLVEDNKAAPWALGDAMAEIEKMKVNPSMNPRIAKLLPANTCTLTRKGIIGIVCSWVEAGETEVKQYYDYIDVATEFPAQFLGAEVRCNELKFTNHSEVLRAVKKLRKKKWLEGWNDGVESMANRRDLLRRLAEKKKESRLAKMRFGRSEIEKLVSDSDFCCKEHRGEPVAEPKRKTARPINPTINEIPSEQPTLDDSGPSLNFYQVDGPAEDKICYIATMTDRDAQVLLGAYGAEPAGMNLKLLGRLNITAGVYELRRIEEIKSRTEVANERH